MKKNDPLHQTLRVWTENCPLDSAVWPSLELLPEQYPWIGGGEHLSELSIRENGRGKVETVLETSFKSIFCKNIEMWNFLEGN